MRILILGATGYVGSHLVYRLGQAGHEIVCGVRDLKFARGIFPESSFIVCDFMCDMDENVWLSRLTGIDVLINCVGVLQGSPHQMWQTHFAVPKALFAVCVKASIKQVIQISAPGVDAVDIPWAVSRRQCDDYLLSLPIKAHVLRPSFIYGPGSFGGGSLFRALAALPGVVVLPGAGDQCFMPIHVYDLARAIDRMIGTKKISSGILFPTGPDVVSIKSIVLQMRQWLGYRPGQTVAVPVWMIRGVSW